MKTIYKYYLSVGNTQYFIPKKHKVLFVAAQNNIPHIWIEHEINGAYDTYANFCFVTQTTGGNIYDNDEYCGSYQLDGGKFVGHVYKRAM